MKPNVTSVVEDPELVEKRRAQIVAAATTLFAEQGFHRTTVKDIAKKAGISSGLVYLYVREKEDVLLLVLLEVFRVQAEELPRALEGIDDPLLRVVATIEALVSAVDRNRAAVVLAQRSTATLTPERRLLVREREREIADIVADVLIAAMKARLVRPIDVDVATHQIVTIAQGWALRSWHFKGRIPLEAWIRSTLDILVTGIATPAGLERWAEARADKEAKR
ncbi:MAG: TetR/AcrR family transcriptional regulator [Siculibacillus sp.]